jgi:hypothetical protein
MLIAEPDDSKASSLDVPCNIALMFRVVDDAVAMTVVNRSNDAIFGLPYDIFSLSLLHFAITRDLGKKMGHHLHITNSMHMYLANADLAERALSAGPPTAVPSGNDAVEFLDMLVDHAAAIAALDLANVPDERLRRLLEASVSGSIGRRNLAAGRPTDWLEQVASTWARRGRTSVVATVAQRAG